MASRDWFRTSDWHDDARADFEARLARARSHSRPQYLRIKALALREAGDDGAAAMLLARVVEEYGDSFDAPLCAELLGDLAARSGNFAAAEARYRESLRLRPDQNGTTGTVHIGLAGALAAQGRHGEALEALESFPLARLTLNSAVCRWNAALAESAYGVGENDVARAAAARALALLDAPDQFARHPGAGRAVLPAEREARLRRLASGEAPAAPARRRWFGRRG